MLPKLSEGHGRVHRRYHFTRHTHSPAGFRNAVPDFIVVRQHIRQSFIATDFREPGFCRRYGCAQRKRDTFHPVSHQNARRKIRRYAQRFNFRPKVVLRHPSVKAALDTRFGVFEWRSHLPQIIRPNSHVTVTLHQQLVLRFAR